MKPVRKNRLKRRRRAAREAKSAVAESTDEETEQPPIRTHRKRRKREPDFSEDIIDGFSIRSYKNLELLHKPKKAETQQPSANNAAVIAQGKLDKKEESPESSSVNAIEESYVSSAASTGCGGYLGENEKSEDEDGKAESKLNNENEEENFFCTARTDERLKETFKQAEESEPMDDDDDDVILCPTPEPIPVEKKTPAPKPATLQPKPMPHVAVTQPPVPPPAATPVRGIASAKLDLKKPPVLSRHVKVPPTMTVQPEQRKSNLVMPMIPVVKPASSMVGPTQPSYGLNSRRQPGQQLPGPPLYSSLTTPSIPPPMPAHPSLLDQGYLQAELNSRFLQESQAAERHRSELHHAAHQHSLAHHTFNRVVSLPPPPSYGAPSYYPANYGAFHPKIHPNFSAHVVNQSTFHPQTHPVLSMSQIAKDPTLSAPCKKHPKPGRWCALHVKIAFMIQNHQKKQDKGEVFRSQKNKVSSFYTPQHLSSSDGSRSGAISSLAWRSRRPPVYPARQTEAAQSSNYHPHHHSTMLPMSSNVKQDSTSALYHHHHLPNAPGTGPSSINHNGQPMTELSRAPAHVLHSRYDYYTPSAIANGANAVAAASMLPTNTIPPPFATSLLPPTAATNAFYPPPQYYLCGAGAMSGGAFNNQSSAAAAAAAAAAAHHHPYVRR